jgi:hypothetical protein
MAAIVTCLVGFRVSSLRWMVENANCFVSWRRDGMNHKIRKSMKPMFLAAEEDGGEIRTSAGKLFAREIRLQREQS